jgi:hypothetical protein
MNRHISFDEPLSRRNLASLAIAAVVLSPLTANAGYSQANALLAQYGLPPVSQVPDGFSPCVERYGQDGARVPLLVQV